MFDWRIYLHNYPDLTKDGIDSETKAVEHWKTQGIKERRVANKLLNTDEFNWVIYLNNNPDLLECDITSEKEALQHWLIHGKNENRVANKDIVGHIYNKTTTIKSNENDNEFIKLSLKYLKLVRILPVPPIPKDGVFEAVFIEYKRIPYCEFTIRNTIFKLGEKWCHTIICGNSNYEYMNEMCKLISPNIRVVQTNYDSMNENEYNKLLLSMEFWNLLRGSKILIYKKKSLIFKNNVEDFIEWDYISSPFLKINSQIQNKNRNSGFTLRTKEIMKRIISKVPHEIKNGESYPSESVYFSQNMQSQNIGKVADYETSKKFCLEFHSLNKNDSLAGYNFWNYNKEWKKNVSKAVNFSNYSFGKHLDKYIEHYKKTQTRLESIDVKVVYERKNHFDIDFHFYKIVNQLDDSVNVCKHLHDFGIYGLIYHPRQLLNIYPNLNFKTCLNNILVKNEKKYYTTSNFVKDFVYKKSFQELEDLLIQKEVDNMSPYVSSLLILVFIGNEYRGIDLFEKIKKYKNLQTFNIAFCFNSSEKFTTLKKEIETTFTYYSIYNTSEMGTDITPTLLMYSNIKKTHDFSYIIKLQTKTASQMYHDLTNFLLNKPFSVLVEKKIKNSNCIGEYKNYAYVNKEDTFNKVLVEKYKNSVHDNFKFVKGTIFSCETKVFDAVLNFVEKNNYHSYLLNNFYENNSINYDNSPIHYLERLFGVIRC